MSFVSPCSAKFGLTEEMPSAFDAETRKALAREAVSDAVVTAKLRRPGVALASMAQLAVSLMADRTTIPPGSHVMPAPAFSVEEPGRKCA